MAQVLAAVPTADLEAVWVALELVVESGALSAEQTDRAMRSISHQMKAAKFPIHRELAGFDFASEPAKELDQRQVDKRSTLAFADTAQNVVFIGGPGTGKAHLSFSQWSWVFGDAKRTTALLDRLTQHCHLVQTGKESHRYHPSSLAAKSRIKERAQSRKKPKATPMEPF